MVGIFQLSYSAHEEDTKLRLLFFHTNFSLPDTNIWVFSRIVAFLEITDAVCDARKRAPKEKSSLWGKYHALP